MNLYNQYTAVILLLSFPLKALFQYLHLKKFGNYNDEKISNYLFAFPIIDKQKSSYKLLANSLVIYQYGIIIIALFENRSLLYEIWKIWDKVP